MSWTPEKIELLTSLWNQGWTTARIGEELGVGKNAVVGKAHRLGLPKRPSPIQRRAEEAEQKKAPAPKQQTKGITIFDLGPGMCRWPFGDPGDDDFHFCGKKIIPGKPYCDEHCAQAYLNGKNPREDNPLGIRVAKARRLQPKNNHHLIGHWPDQMIELEKPPSTCWRLFR